MSSRRASNIQSATSGAWSQTYGYDGFGNLTAKNGSGATFTNTVDQTTNRLTGGNYCYDADGNMVSDQNGGGCANPNYTYDVANRLVSAKVSGGTEYYWYSADNKRIARFGTAGETIYIYGASGEKLLVVGNGASNVYFAGRLIKQNTDAVLASADNNFVAVDGMGSVVYAAPTSEGALQVNTSYLPYGEELSATTNDVIKFATYTRDSSTGLDYADQRFYTSQFGRFMSADRFVQTSKANDSGSWNKYAYTRGDPVNRTDVHGTCDEEDGYTGCDPLGGGGTMPRPGTPCTDDRPGPHADCAGSAGGGSPDVSKSYSETINCNETSAQLLTKLESNFGSFANYSGTFGPGGAPAAAAQIQFSGNVSLGSTINITDVNTIFLPFLPTQTQTVAVTVSAISSSGFTFTTLPGHVLFPATTSFSATTGANGQLTFAVNVNGNFANSTSQALYNVGGSNLENKIWNNLLANVQTDCSK